MDADGAPMDPRLLAEMMGGLDQEMFGLLYGIDHDSLIRGGREMVAHQGAIGGSLFSAGANLGRLRETLAAMADERDDLYKKNGKKPAINRALSRLRDLDREIRALSLKPDQWQAVAKELDRIKTELNRLTRIRRQRDRERHFLERLLQAAPLLARQRNLREKLAELGEVTILPPDFAERKNRIRQQRGVVEKQLAQTRKKLAEIQAGLEAVPPATRLLARGEEIGALIQRLGEYRKAGKDLDHRRGMRTSLRQNGRRLITALGRSCPLDEADRLLVLLGRKNLLLDLITEHSTLTRALEDCRARKHKVSSALQRLERQLGDPVPVPDQRLADAVRRMAREGDLDAMILELKQDIQQREQALELQIGQAGYWQGTIAALPALVLVPLSAIRAFQDRFRELDGEERRLAGEEERLAGERISRDRELAELEHRGPMVSEEEMRQARQRREQGWRLVCRNWLDGEDIEKEAADYGRGMPLAEAVHEAMRQADRIADQLRREADRLHAHQSLLADIRELEQRLRVVRDQRLEVSVLQTQAEKEWRAFWRDSGVTPGPPQAMIEWRGTMVRLQEQALEINRDRERLANLAQRRQQLARDLAGLLQEDAPADGARLGPLLERAEDRLRTAEEAIKQRELDIREQEGLRDRLRETGEEERLITEKLEQWQGRWREQARLDGHPFGPENGRDILDTLVELDGCLREIRGLDERIHGMERDRALFEDDLRQLVAEVATDLDPQSPETCIRALDERLTRARRGQTRREEHQALAAELAERIQVLSAEQEELAAAMRELMALARVREENGLEDAEQRSTMARQWRQQLEQVENDMSGLCGDHSTDELAEALAREGVDSLPGRIHQLNNEIESELDPAIQDLLQKKGEQNRILSQMDGSGEAAARAEERQGVLAALRTDAQRYLRLQVGIGLLETAMEHYRRENQDPILALASTLFHRLTLGSFTGLRSDLDHQGQPVLVAVRDRDQPTLTVDALSSGSRDQMFLALRLAALHHRQTPHTLPLIVDDILVNFDDDRARATLEVLAELAGSGHQIILFSHHRQVAAMAAAIDGVRIHELTTG